MKENASFREAAAVAADSLRSSKLRSFLTLLGIILATTTLIAVMSIIHGMDVYIAENVSDMGADGFHVYRMAFIGDYTPKKFMLMQKRNPELSPDEFEFLRSHAKLVRDYGMQAERTGRVEYSGNSLDSVTLQGVTANFGMLNNVELTSGRFLTDMEDRRRLDVAIIGSDISGRFFAGIDSIGKTIKVDGHPYTVIGVAKPKGSAFGQSLDEFVLIPIGAYFQYYGARQGIDYIARATDRLMLDRAQDETRMLLRAYRHLRPQQDDTFSIVTSDAFVRAWDQLTGAIAVTATAVVAVFMVVGGVVIMNIMLAVVTERTREIGIRKSVGARRQDILNQFLVESSMLAAAGGLLGVVSAWLIAVLVRTFTPVPMNLPISAVVLGVGLSAMVGLFFGVYPAQRAARLDPIEALRAEQ
jgi:putative ABC transport system permease protein